MKVHSLLRTCVATLFALVTVGEAQAAGIFPSTVSELDVPSYMGKWYEVQSTKPFFQKGCVCNTAEYTLKDNGAVSVVNRCNDSSPAGHERVFEATALTTSDPGKLKVSTLGIFAPVPNYWVVDLAPDYSYAVVSSFIRNPVWILSRTPELSAETLNGIYERLVKNGFDTSALSETLQTGCWN